MASNQRGGRVAASHPPPKRKPLTVSTEWKKNRGGTPTGKERRNYPPHSFPPPCISFSRHAVSITRPIAGPRSPRRPPLGSPFRWSIGSTDSSLRVSILCAARILPDLRLFESLNRTTRNTESRQQTRRASSKFSGRFFPPREKSLEKALERSHEERDKEGEGEKAGKIPGYAPFLFARPVRIIFLANFSPPLLPPFFLLSSRYRLSPRATSTKKERKEKEKRRGERKGEIAN